jgi:hypothetical protein
MNLRYFLLLTEANLYLETKDFEYKVMVEERNPNDADLIFGR